MIDRERLDACIDELAIGIARHQPSVVAAQLKAEMEGHERHPRTMRAVAGRLAEQTLKGDYAETFRQLDLHFEGLLMAIFCGALLDSPNVPEEVRFTALEHLHLRGCNPPDRRVDGYESWDAAAVLPELLRATGGTSSERIAVCAASLLADLSDDGMDLSEQLLELVNGGDLGGYAARTILRSLEVLEASCSRWERTRGVLLGAARSENNVLAFLAMSTLGQIVARRLFNSYFGLFSPAAPEIVFASRLQAELGGASETVEGRVKLVARIEPILCGYDTTELTGVAYALYRIGDLGAKRYLVFDEALPTVES